MGNVTLNCVSCLNREDEEHGVKPLNSYRAPQDAEEQNNTTGKEFQLPSALEKAAEEHWQKAPAGSDSELQNQINAIVSSHAQRCKPSPAKSSPDSALQAQINYIVGAHAKSLNQQRIAVAKTTELVSPSPAKSYTDDELGYFANIALSQAKARSTPSKTPTPLYIPRVTCEDEIVPCQLNFADYDNENDAPPTTDVPEPNFSAIADSKKDLDDDPKSQTRPFNLSEIPSPTRNRAKKLWAEAAKVAAEEALATSTLDEAHRVYLEKKREAREAEKKSEAENKEFYSAEEDEEDDEEDEQENEEAIRLRAKLLQEEEEKRQQTAMDKMCVDAFLKSVARAAWTERGGRTPIKGSNLYVKHMRPCRDAGTSVDVKDSSFKFLGTFLEFLEAEGLLSLRPGLTDPVVTGINFEACRKYKYPPTATPQATPAKSSLTSSSVSLRPQIPALNLAGACSPQWQ